VREAPYVAREGREAEGNDNYVSWELKQEATSIYKRKNEGGITNK
jgi:hypothetical protein